MAHRSRSVQHRMTIPSLVAALLAAASVATPAGADQWVFTPSIGLDQRFDDNYRLEPIGARRVSATRLVGDLGISRETALLSIVGTARADLRLELGDTEDNAPDSNQILLLDLARRYARGAFELDLGYVRDTPSRDISADITDDSSSAVDSGVVTQDYDVARQRIDLKPSFRYDLSRRSSVEGSVSYADVAHDLPDAADTIYTQYLQRLSNPNLSEDDRRLLTDENGDVLPPDEVNIETLERTSGGGVFRPTGELDDYDESRIDLGFRFRLDRISSVSAFVGYSRYVASVEANDGAFTDDEQIPDSDVRQILRAPRRDAISETTTLRIGYDRQLDQTLDIALQAGVYQTDTDDSDTYRRSDGTLAEFGRDGQPLPDAVSSESGWLANVTLVKDANLTRYTARFAIDVLPSSAGSQVETQELTGQVFRQMSPLIDLSLSGRAYEPDRLGAKPDDRFARRFISLEPKITWRFARAWTAAAAYRYRRQKARVDQESSESNAVLLSLRYTPPSRIRDLAE